MNRKDPNARFSKTSIDELIDLAKKEELNNNYFEAIILYSLAIKKNNDRNDNSYTSAWFLRGKLNLKIRKYRDAKYDLGICISICQENMELLYKAIHKPLFKSVFLRCIANLMLNDEAYFNDWVYIQKSQSYRHLFFIRGLNYSLKNETKKAMEEYEKVLKIAPNFFKANKCKSTGLVPIAHPPGNETFAFLYFANSSRNYTQ